MVHWRREWQTTSLFLPENLMNSMKRQKDMTLKNELPQVSRCPICYFRRVEKQLQKEWRDRAKVKTTPSCDVAGDGGGVRCCKDQYCIGTWNARSTNQVKLEVAKQEMARVKVDILGISELKWPGKGKFNKDDHHIYYYRQDSLRRKGVAIMVSKRVWNAVLGCNLKNDRMISVLFQGKPFNITVIQVYAPTSNAEEAEVEQFYEDL